MNFKYLILLCFCLSGMARAHGPKARHPAQELPEVVPTPVTAPLVPIRKVELERNEESSYCLRNMEVADTIVFHHAASGPNTGIEEINAYHLQRGTYKDPWLMIGYHYAINGSYDNEADDKEFFVTEGRPLEIVGAHAGSDAYTKKVSKETLELVKKTGVTCGVKGEEFKPKKDMYNPQGQIKANVPSVGIVFIGNYAPFSASNPSGYSAKRFPNDKTLELAAKLSCQLQKQYPRLKFISYHKYYRQTECPGTVIQRLESIKKFAEKYGCEFSL